MTLLHAGAVLTVHSDGAGSVWITATWTDGHPVTGPASAILTATAAGQRVGPVALRPLGDGALTYTGQLPSGQWTVTAEMAVPAVARCDAELEVGAPPKAVTVTCEPPPEAAPEAGGSAAPWPAVTLAGAVVAVLVAALVLARRQRRHRAAGWPRR